MSESFHYSSPWYAAQQCGDEFNKSKRITLFLGRKKAESIAESWMQAFNNTYAETIEAFPAAVPGVAVAKAKRVADQTIRESTSITLWIFVIQLVLKIVWEWWKRNHPTEFQAYEQYLKAEAWLNMRR